MIELFDKNRVLLSGIITGDVTRSTNGVGYRTLLNVFNKKFQLFIPAEVYLKLPYKAGAFVDVIGGIVRAKNGHCIYVQELKPAKASSYFRNQATVEGRVIKEIEYARELKQQCVMHTAHTQIKNIPDFSNSVTVRISSLVEDTPVVTSLRPDDKIIVNGPVLTTETQNCCYLYMFGNSIKRK